MGAHLITVILLPEKKNPQPALSAGTVRPPGAPRPAAETGSSSQLPQNGGNTPHPTSRYLQGPGGTGTRTQVVSVSVRDLLPLHPPLDLQDDQVWSRCFHR